MNILDMSMMDVIKTMAEGNPGATNVLIQLIEKEASGGLMAIVHLEDMGFRADKIWVCYKDICNQDIDELIRRSIMQCPEMSRKVHELYTGIIRRDEL